MFLYDTEHPATAGAPLQRKRLHVANVYVSKLK